MSIIRICNNHQLVVHNLLNYCSAFCVLLAQYFRAEHHFNHTLSHSFHLHRPFRSLLLNFHNNFSSIRHDFLLNFFLSELISTDFVMEYFFFFQLLIDILRAYELRHVLSVNYIDVVCGLHPTSLQMILVESFSLLFWFFIRCHLCGVVLMKYGSKMDAFFCASNCIFICQQQHQHQYGASWISIHNIRIQNRWNYLCISIAALFVRNISFFSI